VINDTWQKVGRMKGSGRSFDRMEERWELVEVEEEE